MNQLNTEKRISYIYTESSIIDVKKYDDLDSSI